MESPFFSIVFPIYNVDKYLEKSVESVLKQDFDSYELILVDDGSTDGSLRLAESYAKKYSKKIIVVKQKNAGAGMARNKGLMLASGKYIYFMDPDDWIDQGLLSRAYELLKTKMLDVYIFGNNYINNGIVEKKSFCNFGFLDRKGISNKLEAIVDAGKLSVVWDKFFNVDFLKKNGILFPNWKNGQDGGFLFQSFGLVNSAYFDNKVYYNFVINRYGSMTSKFKTFILENCSKKVKYFRDMLIALDIYNYKIFKKMYVSELIVFAVFENITNEGSPFKMRDKKKYVKSSLNYIGFYEYDFSDVTNSFNFPTNILLFLIKHNCISTAIVFFSFKRKIKKYVSRLE